MNEEPIRLQRFLSQAGVAARRKAEDLIRDGAVTVNGKRVTKLGTKVVPGRDRVAVEGRAVYPEEPFYVLLNKPKGCITAVSDPQGRPTVMEYLRGVPARVTPVGRLDFYSEGVLLLTNDGELTARLLSPRSHVEKTYHVKVRGHVTEAQLELLREGVVLDDGTRTRPAQVDVLPAKSRHDWLVITLTEGKSRQIHRMLEAMGHRVSKLQRVAFAGLSFHGLRVGDARELTQTEVNGLRELVRLPKSTVARGKWHVRREDTELNRRALGRQRAQAEEMAAEASTTARGHRRPAGAKGKPGESRTRGRRTDIGGRSSNGDNPRFRSKPRRGGDGARSGPGGRSGESGTGTRGRGQGRGGPERGEYGRGEYGRSEYGRSEYGRNSTGRGSPNRGSAGRSSERRGNPSRGSTGRGEFGRSEYGRNSAGRGNPNRGSAGRPGASRPGRTTAGRGGTGDRPAKGPRSSSQRPSQQFGTGRRGQKPRKR